MNWKDNFDSKTIDKVLKKFSFLKEEDILDVKLVPPHKEHGRKHPRFKVVYKFNDKIRTSSMSSIGNNHTGKFTYSKKSPISSLNAKIIEKWKNE